MEFKIWLNQLNETNERDGDDSTVIDAPPPQVQNAEPQLEHPKMYVVMLHNNDYTPFQVVVITLQTVFHLTAELAQAIMMHAHQNGKAQIGGICSKDVAEAKASQAQEFAKTLDSRELAFTAEEV